MFRPVAAKLWRQHETFDGTYTLDDLLDVHELLDLKEEAEYQQAQQLKNNHG